MLDFIVFGLAALVLTVAIETVVAIALGFRGKKDLVALALINTITNPLLNYLIAVNGYFHLVSQNTALTLVLESLVVIVEWRLLLHVLHRHSRSTFALSLLANASSFLIGLLILRYMV